jgi:hypothetical protein
MRCMSRIAGVEEPATTQKRIRWKPGSFTGAELPSFRRGWDAMSTDPTAPVSIGCVRGSVVLAPHRHRPATATIPALYHPNGTDPTPRPGSACRFGTPSTRRHAEGFPTANRDNSDARRLSLPFRSPATIEQPSSRRAAPPPAHRTGLKLQPVRGLRGLLVQHRPPPTEPD